MPLASRGVSFVAPALPAPPHPNRADIACFIGHVALRPTLAAGLPPAIVRQLTLAGWWDGPHARPGAAQLLDVPITIHSWEAFTSLFAWDSRPIKDSTELATTYLGAAVRAFFAEGGRECVIIRVGDPSPYGEFSSDRIATLIPGFPFRLDASPADQSSWHGITHLSGLPQVSFLCLPDLPELVAAPLSSPATLEEPLVLSESWVECAPESPTATPRQLYRYPAPLSDANGYERHTNALALLVQFLERYRRDVIAIATLPSPIDTTDIPNLFRFLLDGHLTASPNLQLAYPWLRTRHAFDLPANIDLPEGTLAGQLATNALLRGTFHSATRLAPRTILDTVPLLTREDLLSLEGTQCFLDRVSLYAPTPTGIRLRSDVTTATDPARQPASVNRLIAAITRSARQLGEDLVFENSGESLWLEIEDRLSALLTRFWQQGALSGATPTQAFSVACNRTTMSQNDIDAGRLIANVSFSPAMPITRINISLDLASAAGAPRS